MDNEQKTPCRYDYTDRNRTVIKCLEHGEREVLRAQTATQTLALLHKQGFWAGPELNVLEEKPNGNGHSEHIPDPSLSLSQEGQEAQPVAVAELSYVPPQEIKKRLDLIMETMQVVMQEGVHYGTIPGTGNKKTLLKPGAEILRLLFRLVPERRIERDPEIDSPHRGYIVDTTLKHSVTDIVWGTGVGSCSTLESKYRWRYAKRMCPQCSGETIVKSKYARGEKDYWYCKNTQDCKAKFDKFDEKISRQVIGKIENADLADQYNVVIKMASKRSLVGAILDATGADALFMAPKPGSVEEEDGGDEEDV